MSSPRRSASSRWRVRADWVSDFTTLTFDVK